MEQQSLKDKKKKILIAITSIIILFMSTATIMAALTDDGCITPADNQYFELKAVEVKDVTGQNKQVTMELWGNNIEFKGFDVRFTYDSTKFQTSNLLTNVVTSDTTQYFQFEDDFKDYLEFYTIPFDVQGNGMRATLAFNENPPTTETSHIINKEGIGQVVSLNGSVLLGKMSFQMNAEEFDISSFKLVKGEELNEETEEIEYTYPTTGIKINIDGFETGTSHNYQAQSTFRFSDETSSKDASLTNLVISTGEVNETDPTASTYKKYDLVPEFSSTTTNYELTLLEYIDTMDVTATVSDTTATMKLKVPKRDDDGNLVYQSDQIVYEEKSIQNATPCEFTLNKLGEPDTKITVIVTAEDGVTTKEYTVTIKRPYGTIKGQVQLGETLRSTGESYEIFLEYIADIKVYEAGKFIWSDLITANTDYSVLDAMPIETSTQSDANTGQFTIYVIPGQYDVFIEKLGFTQTVDASKTINEGDSIDLGLHILHEGDVNRDGILDVQDLTTVKNVMLMDSTNPWYESQCDFLGKGYVDVVDLTATKNSLFESKTIEIR